MIWLKQSTSVTIKMGPFLDSTDGVTEEIALTISQADIRLSKNGGNITQSNNATGGTHDELGYYDIPLNTTDTNTLGALLVSIHESGALPVWEKFMIAPANVWDSFFGADKLQVDITQIGDNTQSATDLKNFADEGYDPSTNKVEGVKLVDTTTINTDMVTEPATAVQNRQEMDSNSTQLSAIKAKTDNLPSTLKKNTAITGFTFPMKDSSGDLVPGLSDITFQISLDGISYSTITNNGSIAEIGSTGTYQVNLTAGDLNGDVAALKLTSASAQTVIKTVILNS